MCVTTDKTPPCDGFENQAISDPPYFVAKFIRYVIQHFVKSSSNDDNRLNPISGYVAACPRLTEVTIFPYNAGVAETGILHHLGGRALPDLYTLRIFIFPPPTSFCILVPAGEVW